MRVDLRFKYSDETFLRLSKSYNVVNLEVHKSLILVELSQIQKHFLDTKQLTKAYIKKNL